MSIVQPLRHSLLAQQARALVPVIPDIKLISPQAGPLFAKRDPQNSACRLVRRGAPVLSVVTQAEDFGGSLELMAAIADAVPVPVLRKDFLTTRADLEQSKAYGASAVLLICAALSAQQLCTLYEQALALDLEPLVEVHTPAQMQLANTLNAPLIGINNRDILCLERDHGTVATTARLAPLAAPHTLLISESGITGPQQVRQARRAGATAVLVGTAIWQAPVPELFYDQLCQAEMPNERPVLNE